MVQKCNTGSLAILCLRPFSNPRTNVTQGFNLLWNRLAMPQGTQSRKQRSFCTTTKVRGIGCVWSEKTNDNRMTRSPSNQMLGFYSNDRNSYNSLGPCACRSSKLSSSFSPSLVSFRSTSTSPPFIPPYAAVHHVHCRRQCAAY